MTRATADTRCREPGPAPMTPRAAGDAETRADTTVELPCKNEKKKHLFESAAQL